MELVPQELSGLLARMYAEARVNEAVFALPKKKWYVPAAGGPDLSVNLHGRRAGNPSGPAAGPHTQMAQNLLLSYAAGGRVLELKTVQVNDRLAISRPCIDMTTIGYNVEWSQELLVEQSLREYVAGMMLIEIFRRDPAFCGDALLGSAGDVIFDMSVGYDLDGIRSPKVRGFLDGMRDARKIVEELRATLPAQYKLARELDYPTSLSTSITLSTFHGCPADQIEKICEFLIAEKDLDVIVKMNPPMLGKERLEYLLYDVMDYRELTVAPQAYTSGLQFDESLELVARLTKLAKEKGRHFGAKFSNTLEVLNHKTFFTPENKTQYLSGQPLHVITMALTDVFRQAVGPELPISFSAGIDRQNFPLAVACGFVPASVCSDLLRPGGFGRLPGYMQTLAAEMGKLGAKTIDEYIVAFAAQNGFVGTNIEEAAVRNTTTCAGMAKNDARYRAASNRKTPNRINSHLVTFDCITCDKCIPVCPNAANFIYPSEKAAFICQDVVIAADGSFTTAPGREFAITKDTQIANYADFCNECGNCDTFCPEYGGPYIQKPAFYSSEHSYQQAAPRDGFLVNIQKKKIIGRVQGREYALSIDFAEKAHLFLTPEAEVEFDADHAAVKARQMGAASDPLRVDTWTYHILRYLLRGMMDMRHVHQVNAQLAQAI